MKELRGNRKDKKKERKEAKKTEKREVKGVGNIGGMAKEMYKGGYRKSQGAVNRKRIGRARWGLRAYNL